MAKTPIKRVAPVLKEEIAKQDAAATAKEAQQIVADLQAKQDDTNKEEAARIAKYSKRDEPLSDHTDYTMAADYTYVPDHVDVDGVRRDLKDPNKNYRWGRYHNRGYGKVDIHRLRGWKPVMYDPIFTDTNMFRKSVEGWVLNGDIVWLEISKSGFARLQAEKQKRYDQLTAGVKSEFANTGAKAGVDTFEEIDGRQEYN